MIAWTRNRNLGRRISLEQYLSLGHVAIHVGEGAAPNFNELFLGRLKTKGRAEVVAHSFDVVCTWSSARESPPSPRAWQENMPNFCR